MGWEVRSDVWHAREEEVWDAREEEVWHAREEEVWQVVCGKGSSFKPAHKRHKPRKQHTSCTNNTNHSSPTQSASCRPAPADPSAPPSPHTSPHKLHIQPPAGLVLLTLAALECLELHAVGSLVLLIPRSPLHTSPHKALKPRTTCPLQAWSC
eukprot:4806-Chlamydomonas_euryale.AAC.1